MSAQQAADAAITHAAPQSRVEFYSQLRALDWESDHGERVRQYLVDNTPRIPTKQLHQPTLFQVLLGLVKGADGALADNLLLTAIDHMPDSVRNEAGGIKELDTGLHSAVSERRQNVVSRLAQMGLDLSARNWKGQIPLHLAASVGDLAIAQALVAADTSMASLTCKDKNGRIPLSLACQDGHAEVAEYLVDMSPASMLVKDRAGYSSWHRVLGGGQPLLETFYSKLDTNKELLQHREPAIKTVDNGMEGGELGARRAIAEESSIPGITPRPEDVASPTDAGLSTASVLDSCTNSGKTLLHLACIKGKVEAVDFLLSKGADPTIVYEIDRTCLFAALSRGHFEVGRRLLSERAVTSTLGRLYASGVSLLSLASMEMEATAVEVLLEAGADCTQANDDSSKPIILAIKSRKLDNLSMLLASESFNSNISEAITFAVKDENYSTALHLASRSKDTRYLKQLLTYGVDCNIKDSEERTCLHEASRLGKHLAVAMLLDHRAKVDELDKRQWSALHYASYESSENFRSSSEEPDLYASRGVRVGKVDDPYVKIVRSLLRRQADVALEDRHGNLALHLAAAQGHARRVTALLQGEASFLLSKTNNRGETPLFCALQNRHLDASSVLGKKTDVVAFSSAPQRDNLLTWLTEEEQTHDLVATLLAKQNHLRNYKSMGKSALQWAALSRSVKLVWWLLQYSSPGIARDQRIKDAIVDVNHALELQIAVPVTSEASEAADLMDGSRKSGAEGQETRVLDAESKEYTDILVILHNPPATGQPGRATLFNDGPCSDAKGQPAHIIDKYRVELVDCYNDSFLRRSASIKEALYTNGPIDIMRETSQRTRECYAELTGSKRPEGIVRETSPPNVIWIHLPANNMEWHKDVCLKVSSGLKQEFDRKQMTEPKNAGEPSLSYEHDPKNIDWLSGTWEEILGSGRQTNYMKPLCSVRVDSKRNNTCAAIYMPYVAPAWHPGSRNGDGLVTHYTNRCKIHGTRTLDEFFYHHCRLDGIEKTMKKRNKDQVLSKWLYGDLKRRTDWILVNVDQLWVWIPNRDTIVTSATHRHDSEYDPVFAASLEALNEAMRSSNKAPQDAFDMANLIMNTCIHFLHRQFHMNTSPSVSSLLPASALASTKHGASRDDSSDSSDTSVGDSGASAVTLGRNRSAEFDSPSCKTRPVCIKEIFSNATADAAAKESNLYQRFIKKQKRSSRSPTSLSKRIQAAKLLREIKDIRDELKMLRVISEYQYSVKARFDNPSGSELGTIGSQDVVDELHEMDKAVEQIERSVGRAIMVAVTQLIRLLTLFFLNKVNITLNLQQNATSISQTDAAVRQGKIVLLFTVVTIIFLPMSFCTSLFAVQVDSFLKTPPWAFGVMFGGSSLISATLAVYAFYSNAINSFVTRNWQHLPKWRIRKRNNLPRPQSRYTDSYYSYSDYTPSEDSSEGIIDDLGASRERRYSSFATGILKMPPRQQLLENADMVSWIRRREDTLPSRTIRTDSSSRFFSGPQSTRPSSRRHALYQWFVARWPWLKGRVSLSTLPGSIYPTSPVTSSAVSSEQNTRDTQRRRGNAESQV